MSPRPVRPPSEVVRLPTIAVDVLRADAEKNGGTVGDAARRLLLVEPDAVAGPGPMPAVLTVDPLEDQRNGPTSAHPTVCSCSKPTPTGYGVCTTCHLRRP